MPQKKFKLIPVFFPLHQVDRDQHDKKLGFSLEVVFEIGQWESVEAFCPHYKKLGAQENLENPLQLNFGRPGGV